MPSVSAKQAKLMRAAAHGWKKPGGGPSVAVAKEFVSADKKKKVKKFGIGGILKYAVPGVEEDDGKLGFNLEKGLNWQQNLLPGVFDSKFARRNDWLVNPVHDALQWMGRDPDNLPDPNKQSYINPYTGELVRYKKGGKVASSMEKRHAAWMKAHGAPEKMVQEEQNEKMKCGGKVKKPKKFAGGGKVSDAAKNDRMAADFLNQGKKVMGTAGGGPRRGGVKKYASGGAVRGMGCAQRGKGFKGGC